MRRLLLVLSGARLEVLDRCPTERGRFEGIGGAVLTTGVLAMISMTFALHSALGAALSIALPTGVAWGFAIMGLDRMLVATIQADGPRRWRTALPRILMAVLMGVVISTPLVLRIFKSEIDVQIVEIKQDRADKFANEQKKGAVGREVARLNTSVTNLRKVIASGGDVPLDPSQDPKIKELTAERGGQQALAAQYYKNWQCQLYGGTGCPSKGDGVLARASKADYEKARGRVDALNAQIERRRAELTSDDENAKRTRLDAAKADLPGVQTQLQTALARQRSLQSSFDAENRAANGLLIRLQALGEVSGKDLTLRAAHLLLFLLFLLIECLPVAVKLMQKPGNYEKILKLTARQEYRSAREGIALRPGSTESAEPGGGVIGIWERPPAAEPDVVAVAPNGAPPYDEPMTVSDDPRPDPPSFEDEALRDMRDTRALGTANNTGSSGERSGGFDLFPGDD